VKSINRRSFLRRSGACLLAAPLVPGLCQAAEPFKRSGSPRLRLSLAAYSFRQYFKDTRDRDAAAGGKKIDLFDFIDFCADNGCEGAELTSYYFPKTIDNAFLVKLRRHAFLRGITISGTAVGNTFTVSEQPKRQNEIASVNKWIDYAAVMGAPHIRIFAGTKPNGMSESEAKALCISAVEECGKAAAEKGIFLGLENHGGIVAEPKGILEIMQAIKSPWVGINLDTANFRTDDPYRDVELCAPYAVNVQVKSEIHRNGKTEPADLKRLMNILRKANYQGWVALEYEAKPDPWQEVPRLLKELRQILAA
jgi:sugar phosphate isomerase/epimerase